MVSVSWEALAPACAKKGGMCGEECTGQELLHHAGSTSHIQALLTPTPICREINVPHSSLHLHKLSPLLQCL